MFQKKAKSKPNRNETDQVIRKRKTCALLHIDWQLQRLRLRAVKATHPLDEYNYIPKKCVRRTILGSKFRRIPSSCTIKYNGAEGWELTELSRGTGAGGPVRRTALGGDKINESPAIKKKRGFHKL